MEKSDIDKSEDTNTPIKSNMQCNSKQQIVEKPNEHPEWLPDGWDVNIRTRKSGQLMGSAYKCYTDPLKRYKFYSKPEVLRYLENIKDNNCTIEKGKKCTNTHSPRNVVDEKEKEDNNCTSKKEKKCTTTHPPSNVVVEKSNVEDLPPGWIKEVKERKVGNGIKKDPFYTDPVSGYVFRSKKDVLRYLESGDIRTCAFRPSRRQIQDEDTSTPSPAAKRQKPNQSAPEKKLFTGKEVFDKSNFKSSDANSPRKGQHAKVIVKMHSLEDGAESPPEIRKTSDPDYVQEKEHVIVMENANEKNHNGVSKKEFNAHHQFSPQLSGAGPVHLGNNVIKEQTLQVPRRNLRKSRTTLDADMENTSSRHLNGVPKIEQVHKIQEVIKPETRASSNKSSNKKVHSIPRRASKRLAGIELDLMSNSISCDKAPKNKRKMSKDEVNAEIHTSEVGAATELADHAPIKVESANKRKSHKIQPSTDSGLGIVEDEEMGDAKSEPQLSFAFHYSWSDPSLESAINTLMGVLPDKDSVDNQPTTVLETDIPKTPFNSVTGRRDKNPTLEFATNTFTSVLLAEDSVDYGLTVAPGTNTQKTSIDNVTGSRNKKPQVRSNKSKNKKELIVPMRVSKRLAGLEPEVRPSERAVEYVSRKLCKEEPIATATATLTNGASDHLDAGEKTKLTPHASDRLKTEVLGESSNKREKPLDAQTVPNEQLQKGELENIGDERSEQLKKVEAENICDERSESQLPLLFGDPWSDPCLEFAFKTLTGALPVEAPTDILHGSSPNIYNFSNNGLHESVATSMNVKAHDNSNQSQNKKELDMVSQPSTLFLGQPELRTSSTICENAPTFTIRESYSGEGNRTRNLGGEPLHSEASNVTQLAFHSRNISTPIHEWPLKENEKVLEHENITMEQPPLETKNHDTTESQLCSSFMDSWSDSCLEFAFKTLTGAIPVDENLFQEGFPGPANCHDQRDGGSGLPHIGSSSLSQNGGIPFYHDTGVESRPEQQSSTSFSFPVLEKSNLQGCPEVDPKKHYSQWNKNFQR
ncbi:PREDICTED: methyl-CpG-binding domain-containing protein 13-like isoform X3 [Lupinus angustifolius]|uniref:methyl-CpG-binding domain-containing protein 13-like isoform X3 n=1 Tax=Lupinus angustifolius TaxID=3871 RepID=UPI00092E832F|nr:PREDICTED: methyl-CpG-binding domain-containing protein 13-like isoform X3 [Lupinus angustifolius]